MWRGHRCRLDVHVVQLEPLAGVDAPDLVDGVGLHQPEIVHMGERFPDPGLDVATLPEPQDLQALTHLIRELSDPREWKVFHKPRNVAMALSVEVAELMEPLRWLTPEEADQPPFGQATATFSERPSRPAERFQRWLLPAAETG